MSRFTRSKKSVEPQPIINPIKEEFSNNIPVKRVNGTSRHNLFDTLGKTRISPKSLLINDSHQIKNKLMQLHSLPAKTAKKVLTEYQVSDIQQQETQTQSNAINRIEVFKKIKEQFWQQNYKRDASNQFHDSTILMNGSQNYHQQNNQNHNYFNSNNTSRSENHSPIKSSRITKLVYKVPQIEPAKIMQFRLPEVNAMRQSNQSPQQQQTFLTEKRPSFDVTSGEGFMRKKVEIRETRTSSKNKMQHPIDMGNKTHIRGFEESLLNRQQKINDAITSQIENFDATLYNKQGQQQHHHDEHYDPNHRHYDPNNSKPPIINLTDIVSIHDMESKLLKDLANCKVCQLRYDKRSLKTIEDKQTKNDLMQMQVPNLGLDTKSFNNTPNQGESKMSGIVNQKMRAIYRDKSSNEYFALKNAGDKPVWNKYGQEILTPGPSMTNSMKLFSSVNNRNEDSRKGSLPRINEHRNSKQSMLKQNTNHLARESSKFAKNRMKKNLYLLRDPSVMRDNNESTDEPNFLNEPSQDDVTTESFLRKQEQRMEFRQKIKEQFEKHNNFDDFSKLVLLNLRDDANKERIDNSLLDSSRFEPAPKKMNIAFGGLGLKFREKIIKESEDPVKAKFYDFLMSIRDRESMLSQSLRDVSKPKYCKHQSFYHSIIEEKTKELVLEYLKECDKQRAVPLAQAMIQIKNNEYFLSDYQLNEGVVKALCQSFQLSRERLAKLTFSNNQITDDQLADILNSLNQTQLDSCKSIIYCNKNEFGLRAFDVLKEKYLSKIPPFQLEEIRLVNCKIQPGSVNNMLEILKDTCFLKKLSIPKTKLNEYSVDLLVQLISKLSSPNLIDLDISWNELSAHSMQKIIKSLQHNERLQYLNISWNEVREDVDITPLGHFIRNNKNLVHLDISKMFSSETQLRYIIKCIKRAHSLQSVHISNTPILYKSVRLFSYLQKKIGAQERIERRYKKPNTFMLYKNDWKEQMKTMFMKSNGEQELHAFTCYNLSQNESAQSQDNFILQRILKHPEIKGAENWQIMRECVMCGRWQYTIFMKVHENPDKPKANLNPLSGFLGGSGAIKAQQLKSAAAQLEPLIADQNVSIKVKGSYESLMNVRSNKMINILEFAQIIDPDYVDPEQKFEEMLKTLDANAVNQINRNNSVKLQKMNAIKKQIEDDYKENWLAILKKHLRFKQPQYLPDNLRIDQQNENLYVFADFVKPTNCVEQLSIENTPSVLFFPQIRKEEFLPLTYKPKDPQFEDKQANVFKEWKMDSDQILEEVLENDFKYWKINKFIKDPKEIDDIEQLFKQNIKELKKIYLTMISMSTYPNLTWLDFVNFMKSCNIIDDRTQVSTIDRIFIAANVEVEDIQENPDRALCRYELWEILVRIAAQKFKEPNLAQTYSESLDKLLQNNILKYSVPLPWQEFRDEDLWVRDVNLVLDANLDGLNKIYKKYFMPKQQFMSLSDAVNLMTKDSKAGLSFKEATYAYGMSKMTVRNEMEKGQNPYKKMIFVEFLEFIGRCAALKFKRSSEPLHLKIEKLLDEILQVVGMTRKEVIRKVEIPEVESDDSIIEDDLEFNVLDKEIESEDMHMQYFSVMNGNKEYYKQRSNHLD